MVEDSELAFLKPASEREKIQQVKNLLGRNLSTEELIFVDTQIKQDSILSIQAYLRSKKQKTKLHNLQIKVNMET